MDDEALSRGDLYYLANHVTEGNATPHDARRLLAEFVRQARNPKAVDERLIVHVRECFAAFLADEGADSLDKAFGLTRPKRGRPALDEPDLIDAAADYLEERLAGKSDLDARAAAAKTRWDRGLPISSDTQVAEAWSKHKHDALRLVRLRCMERRDDWTSHEFSLEEFERLRSIYRGVPGIVFPDEAPPEGRTDAPS